jgi:hypothetical protein
MASVQELKDALKTEQSRAIEVSDTAIAAIDTLLNLSQYVLTILGIVLAVLALIGIGAMAGLARRAAISMANSRLDDYLKSQEFEDRMAVAVKSEVKERVGNKVILTYLEEEKDGGEPDPFPPAEEVEHDTN